MKSFRRFGDHFFGIDSDQFALVFENAAVDHHGIDVIWIRLLDQQ